ncbi:MAG: hypothetical protein LIO90_03455 [Bacteroidales bacterium]|nr:hypothetical protein [Bacteroidales bacterium]
MTSLAGGVFASAQSAPSDENNALIITRTTPRDSAILKDVRPTGPRAVPVPKFVVKSRSGSFLMTIGGQINPIMGWDLGNDLDKVDGAGINFVTQMIPVPSVKGKKGDYYINALNADLDFTIVGFAGTENQLTGYIKFGTNGISNQVQMKDAYISWRNFTGGLKNTLIQDGDAMQPPTIDPEGPSGCLATSVYEISYTSPSYNGFQYAIGLDMPTWYSSNGVYRGKDFPRYDGQQVADYGEAEQMVPDIPMYIQYQGTPNNRVRVSGIIRNFSYRDLLTDKTRHMLGWGVMLSGNLSPDSHVIFYYQCAYGKGIGAYLQDIAGMPLSFVPNDSKPGHMKASPMMGLNLGLTINFNSKWQFNIMGSESRIWKVGEYATVAADDCNYKYALYGAANIFYNITPYLQWGVEYLYGKRQTWDIGSGHDNRIQTQLLFTL